jgi:hypothetical protein
MDISLWPTVSLLVIRSDLRHRPSYERLVELAGKNTVSDTHVGDRVTPRTIINVLRGETRPVAETNEVFFNMLKALAKEGRLPSFDWRVAELASVRRREFEEQSEQLSKSAGKPCSIRKLRELRKFLLETSCPSGDPGRQITWAESYARSMDRFYHADLQYDALMALPAHFGNEEEYVGYLGASAQSYTESFTGFEHLREVLQKVEDYESHKDYFQAVDLLAKSMMGVVATHLVGFAIEAKNKGWKSEKIPGEEEAADMLRRVLPSLADCKRLASKLIQLFDSPAWKSRIVWNKAGTLIAMICAGSISRLKAPKSSNFDPFPFVSELTQVVTQMPPGEVLALAELPTTQRALQLGAFSGSLFNSKTRGLVIRSILFAIVVAASGAISNLEGDRSVQSTLLAAPISQAVCTLPAPSVAIKSPMPIRVAGPGGGKPTGMS